LRAADTLVQDVPMPKAGPTAPDSSIFANLPVRRVTLGSGAEHMAVHIAGRLDTGRLPLICIPGYQRNMSDFSDFVPALHRALDIDWPIVLVDLRGRGRSAYRRRAEDYNTINDAHDLSMVARALGIEAAVFMGQGHGGQVIMTLAAERPSLIAVAVLVDAGPVTAPESLVRLRSNNDAISGMRGTAGVAIMLRRMQASDYPDASPEELDRLAQRTHLLEESGRARTLFDPALIERLRGFAPDDVLVPQWQLFDLLKNVPLLLIRTELTDQVPRRVFEEMMERRPDAASILLRRQGSPALLNGNDEADAIAAFMAETALPMPRTMKRA
jgi:pimeloyl-ACP methyl ester carboxylesterase